MTLSDNPVYATKNEYAFTVAATDGAGNSAQQEVLLVVVESGNAAPVNNLAYRSLVDSDGRCLYDSKQSNFDYAKHGLHDWADKHKIRYFIMNKEYLVVLKSGVDKADYVSQVGEITVPQPHRPRTFNL